MDRQDVIGHSAERSRYAVLAVLLRPEGVHLLADGHDSLSVTLR